MNITHLLGIVAGATVDFALWVLLLKSVVLLALAWGLNRLLRHVGAAVHHALWTAALIAVLLLPAVSAILPSWSLVLPPLWSWAGTEILSSQATRPPAPRRLVSLHTSIAGIRHPGGKAMGAIVSQRNLAGGEPAQSPSIATQTPVLPMHKAQQSVSWPAGLFLVWLAGAAILLLLRLFGGLAVGRIIRRARRITGGSLAEALERARGKINLPRRVALYVSEETAMPVVRGIFRACVVLPAMAGTWPQGRLQSVLTHELGHVKRWDCLTLLLGQVAAAVYWLNPLVWLACRQLRTQCEQACDDLVLAHGTAAVTYAEDLLAVARTRRVPGLLSAAAVPLARPSQLHRRMLAILDGTVARQGLSRRLLWAAGFATLAFTLAFGMLRPVNKAQAATASAAANATPKSMTKIPGGILHFLHLTIVNTAGEPIPGAKVYCTIASDRFYWIPLVKTFQGTTNSKGKIAAPIPRNRLWPFQVHVQAPHYVRILLSWRPKPFDVPITVPSRLRVVLNRGIAIGGRVVDEHGKPAGGVHVVLSFREPRINPLERVDPGRIYVISNAAGKWSCHQAPPGFHHIKIGLWSRRYDYKPWCRTIFKQLVKSVAELKDGKITLRIKRGIPINGRVFGPNGRPLAGAEIGYEAMPDGIVPPPPTIFKANNRGRFFLTAPPQKEIYITAWAAHDAPETINFQMEKVPQYVEFHLKSGRTLTGQVVNSSGKPISDAVISPLCVNTIFSEYTELDWLPVLRTNAAGWFVWRHAPPGSLQFGVTDGGYASSSGRIDSTLGLDNVSNVHKAIDSTTRKAHVTLYRPIRVYGTVVDAKTDQPIKTFKLIRGIYTSGPGVAPSTSFDWPNVRICHNGKFRFIVFLAQPGSRSLVRIQASGFQAAQSKIFRQSQPVVKLHFALVRADNIVEKVLDSHGKPVAGATAVLVHSRPTGLFEVENGRYPYLNRPQTTTNAKGYLRFSPHKGLYRLLILSRRGYADLKQNQLPKSGIIRLTPWAGIIGRVLVGGKPPVTHRRVIADWIDLTSASSKHSQAWISTSKYPEIMMSSKTLSNANGYFMLKHIPAGNVTLSWNLSRRYSLVLIYPDGNVTYGYKTDYSSPSSARKSGWLPLRPHDFFNHRHAPPFPPRSHVKIVRIKPGAVLHVNLNVRAGTDRKP